MELERGMQKPEARDKSKATNQAMGEPKAREALNPTQPTVIIPYSRAPDFVPIARSTYEKLTGRQCDHLYGTHKFTFMERSEFFRLEKKLNSNRVSLPDPFGAGLGTAEDFLVQKWEEYKKPGSRSREEENLVQKQARERLDKSSDRGSDKASGGSTI